MSQSLLARCAMAESQPSQEPPHRHNVPDADVGFWSAEGGLRVLADTIPHLLWTADSDGSTQYVNSQATEYTGFSAEASSSGQWLSLVHPDDVDRVREAWDEAIRTGTVYELEYRFRRVDGQFRWHYFRSVPVRGTDGQIAKWIGTATDIDDRKALEESLRRVQEQTAETLRLLETIQSASPVGFGFVDREFRFVRANDSLATMVDLPVDQVVGRTVAEIVPTVWPRIEPLYRRVLETGEAVLDVEVIGRTAAEPDRIHSWLATYYPVRVDAAIVGVGLVVLDITKRLEAEAFRSAVMENMAEGLYTIDDQGRVTSVNRAASQLLGWTAEELLGKPMHDTVHFQRADGTRISTDECPAVTARTEGRPICGDDQVFTRKDGSIFPVSYSSAPLYIGSKVGGAVVVFRDITELRERQRREVEARHDQKLESLGRLSAG
ncbi:PAS domain S-box protein, partial [Planosporangium flavigriseum]|uniref:PAS domain-containing protein n=1 Tax=Planosporangium flavigriseum TaxID=373681 RepID=UPI001439DACE